MDSLTGLAAGTGVMYSGGHAARASSRIFCKASSASAKGIVLIQAMSFAGAGSGKDHRVSNFAREIENRLRATSL
jgi:hypothetical protein